VSSVDVVRAHTLGLAEAKERLGALARELEPDGFRWSWDGDVLRFSGRGADGIATPSATDVRVHVELPFLLSGFRGAVEQRVNERLGAALQPRATPAPAPSSDSLPALPGLAATSPQFRAGILAIGRATGFPPDELAGTMSIESGFTPSAQNIGGSGKAGSGATGLIQWMPIRRKRQPDGSVRDLSPAEQAAAETEAYGASLEQIRAMDRETQLGLVHRWFSRAPRWREPGDTYLAVFWPAAVGKPGDYVIARRGELVYDVNSGLDASHDGVLTASDARQTLLWRLARAPGRLDASTPAAGAPGGPVEAPGGPVAAPSASRAGGGLGGVVVSVLAAFALAGLRR